MAMDHTNTIETLNELIKVCKDGEQGFTTAAGDVENGALRALLNTGSQRCAASAQELQNLVRGLGGDPATSGTAVGALHRGWVELRAKTSGHTDLVVLKECEAGEDSAKKSYERSLAQAGLPVEVRQVLERQYQGVIANHDEVRRLRDEYKDHALN